MTNIKSISNGDQLIALIIPASYSSDKIEFFTPNSFSQQLGFLPHKTGDIIQEHVHNLCTRNIQYTQETLIIRKGKVRITFYSDDKKYLNEWICIKGDVILLASGGHGFEFLEDTEMVEVKQGPYCGDQDKVRFKGENGN
ncbi:cupin domain-containing protein [Methanospirillum lacunae]|uniref:Uncharacterized protein n=1 Tax=Methanospirillum lacunae TaxID=668570 RepID=A0A2V2N5X6_9EURY|nr:hypothetical protein [Methanospirillum lacunae]PWR70693.1 hypothetical protein DK846_13870 [Methanospirillum lacunae]